MGTLRFIFATLSKLIIERKGTRRTPICKSLFHVTPKLNWPIFKDQDRTEKAVRRPCSGKSGSERKKQFPKNAFLGAARGACVFHCCLPLYSLLRLPIEHEKTLINWGMQPIKPSKYFLWNFSNFAMIV